jgi:hypothetical protein
MVDHQTEIGMIIGFAFLGACLLFLLLCYCTAHKHEVAKRGPPPSRQGPDDQQAAPAGRGQAPAGRGQGPRPLPGGRGRPDPNDVYPNMPNWGVGR